MSRPFTRAQSLQNAAFLKALARTGNIRLAARETGLKYGTMQDRRAHHAAFATECDAALALAQARFTETGGRHAPKCPAKDPVTGPVKGRTTSDDRGHRTAGGEPVVVRRRDGKLQLRRAQPDKLTPACEQAFLAALSATANVRLSAAAAGASARAFYRRRCQNPAFAREMRMALAAGYERLELALHESMRPDSYRDDAWRHNDPPAMPPMTFDQAFALLQHHQKEVRLQAEPPHIKRRRGESSEARSYRLAAMYHAGLERDREAYEVAEAARLAGGAAGRFELEATVLPDLGVVRGRAERG